MNTSIACHILASHRNNTMNYSKTEVEEARQFISKNHKNAEWVQDYDGSWRIVGIDMRVMWGVVDIVA